MAFGRLGPSEAFGLAGLIFISVLLAIYFFTGLYGSDDGNYTAILQGMRSGDSPWGGARWLISVPYALIGQLLGTNLFWSVWVASLWYLALVLVTVFLTRELSSFWPAICAGFLVAACPLVLFYSGALLPDNIIAVAILCEILFAVKAYEATSSAALLRWSGLAGVMQGLAFTVKEPILIFVVVCPILFIALLLRGNRGDALKAGLAMALGFLLVLAFDIALSSALFGEPFARFSENRNGVFFAQQRMQAEGTYPLERIATAAKRTSSLWKVIEHPVGSLFIWGSLLAPMILLIPIFRRFGVVLVSTTLSFMMLFHVLGSISLTSYVGVPLKARYWAPAAVLFLILAVIIVYTCISLAKNRPRIALSAIAVSAALALGISSIAGVAAHAGQMYSSQLVREFAAANAVSKQLFPGTSVYAGPEVTARVLERYGMRGDVTPASLIKQRADTRQAPFLLWMSSADGDPIKSTLLDDSFEVKKLTPKEHGVLVWKDRRSELMSAFGWPDPAALQPPQSLHIFLCSPKASQ